MKKGGTGRVVLVDVRKGLARVGSNVWNDTPTRARGRFLIDSHSTVILATLYRVNTLYLSSIMLGYM